jgi:DHA1 family multidrug resistance protein-like MFS transporter
MWDIIRESTVGEIINFVSRGRLLPYPDQRADFVIPERYLVSSSTTRDDTARTRATLKSHDDINDENKSELSPSHSDLPTRVTSMAIDEDPKSSQWRSDVPTRIPSSDVIRADVDTRSAARVAKDLEAGDIESEEAEANPQALEKALETAQTEIGDYILVDWYGDDDPENPRNWSSGKRLFVLFEICLLT